MMKQWTQIMPADGWFAVMLRDKPPYYALDRLVGWGLEQCEDEGEQFSWVSGLVACDSVQAASEEGDFYVYIHERDVTPEGRRHWQQVGQEAAAKWKGEHDAG